MLRRIRVWTHTCHGAAQLPESCCCRFQLHLLRLSLSLHHKKRHHHFLRHRSALKEHANRPQSQFNQSGNRKMFDKIAPFPQRLINAQKKQNSYCATLRKLQNVSKNTNVITAASVHPSTDALLHQVPYVHERNVALFQLCRSPILGGVHTMFCPLTPGQFLVPSPRTPCQDDWGWGTCTP